MAAASPDDVSLEPVIHVNLLCQISCSKHSRKRTLSSSEPKSSSSPFTSPYLQVGLVYMPHGSSSEDTPLLADRSSSTVAEIRGDDKHLLHTDITLEELNENLLLKATDYFRNNTEAAIHQMVWRSRHRAAYMEVRKTSVAAEKPRSTRPITSSQQRSRKVAELVQLRDQDLGVRVHMILQFLNSWGAQAPARLRNLIMRWVHKEMEIQVQQQHQASI